MDSQSFEFKQEFKHESDSEYYKESDFEFKQEIKPNDIVIRRRFISYGDMDYEQKRECIKDTTKNPVVCVRGRYKRNKRSVKVVMEDKNADYESDFSTSDEDGTLNQNLKTPKTEEEKADAQKLSIDEFCTKYKLTVRGYCKKFALPGPHRLTADNKACHARLHSYLYDV